MIDKAIHKQSQPQSQQLLFNLCLPDDCTFANFYFGDNHYLVTLLHNFTTNSHAHFLYLWGENGCGRTHLLTACCAFYREKNFSSIYIPLKELRNSSPKILENLESMSLICFDDLDAIIGSAAWEEAIFHCFNRLIQQQRYIIISGNATPSALPFKLQDLKSRMTSGIIHQIQPLNDEQKIAALQFRAEQLGLKLSKKTALFLLNHCARDTVSLFALLRKLDYASMQARRRLTIPFIKQILNNPHCFVR